jgi:hypothetical protein
MTSVFWEVLRPKNCGGSRSECSRGIAGGLYRAAWPPAPVSADRFDDVGDELLLIVASARNPTLGRAMLPEHTTDPPLRHFQSEPDIVDAGTAARGAYQFPEAASFRISLSSVRSATEPGVLGLKLLHPLHLIRSPPRASSSPDATRSNHTA